jgi:hypothetical protein
MGFIDIWGYKKGYLIKIWVCLIGNMHWDVVQQKDFGRYLSISSEIKGIL